MPGSFAYSAGTDTITVTGGTSGSPADFASMYAADVAGAWGQITNPAPGMYVLNANVIFGDGTLATHFASMNEMVQYLDGVSWSVNSAATLRLGELYGSWGTRGSMWSFNPGGTLSHVVNSGSAAFLCYGSRLHQRGTNQLVFSTGTTTIINSHVSSNYYLVGTDYRYSQAFTGGAITVRRTQFTNVWGVQFVVGPTAFSDIHLHRTSAGWIVGGGHLSTSGLLVTSSSQAVFVNNPGDKSATVIDADPAGGAVTAYLNGWPLSAYERYTVKLKVVDAAGVGVSGATVAMTDTFGIAVFSGATDAQGTIAGQTVLYKRFDRTVVTDPTAGVQTVYSPHTLTVSKSGVTATIPNITLDGPIDWTVDLAANVSLGKFKGALRGGRPA